MPQNDDSYYAIIKRHRWFADGASEYYECFCHGYVYGYEEVRAMIAAVRAVWPSASMWPVDAFLDRLADGRGRHHRDYTGQFHVIGVETCDRAVEVLGDYTDLGQALDVAQEQGTPMRRTYIYNAVGQLMGGFGTW